MFRMNFTKILIISHNPMSTYQNMGKTMMSLFDDFGSLELCQLYIYPSIPDVDKCNSYYRITDKDVLNSYYRFKVYGKEITPELSNHQMFASENDEHLYRNKKNKTSVRMIARDVMWKMSHWFNSELREWLDREAPTCIFVAPGTAKFLYDIALKISKYRNIPIVTYICDDYYFVKKPFGILNRLQILMLQIKIEKLIKHSKHLVLICDELKEYYSKKFGLPSTTIMTGSNYPVESEIHVCYLPKTVTYMGNIRCNRYHSLVDIGRALDEINAEYGTDYGLDIYSGEKDQSILSLFEGIRSINFCGFVGGAEFDRVFRSCEILLHTEAFDEKSIDTVKRSVSTKIADSLGSGIPMMAYGPDSVSSMKHLIRNDCAICITSKSELKSKLLSVFSDADALKRVAQNGLKTALRYHDTSKTSRYFYDLMRKINEGTASK